MTRSVYDIVIVGGGMAGATLACALAQQSSLRIAVIDAQAPIRECVSSNVHRVSAITLASQRILQALQVWDEIHAKQVGPFTRIHVWDAEGKGRIEFDSSDIAEPVLGYIVENRVIQVALQQKLKQYPHVDFFAPIKLQSTQETERYIELVSEDGPIFQAKLAVAADGAASWLRSHASIRVDKVIYEQEAIVATVKTAKAHGKIARQVFLAEGPLAFLPLADAHTCSIVWSQSVGEAKRRMALSRQDFKDELALALADHLGAILEVSDRYVFPLVKQQAEQYVKSRIVLIGDAAHTVHPLAGQGANMGLLDAASLSEIIIEAHRQHRDYASHATLRRYERWRRADNAVMLAGVGMIKSLFESDLKVVQSARSLGLNVTDQCRIIKNLFARHAVGERGGLPKLAHQKLGDR